jgi:hypothetical protein
MGDALPHLQWTVIYLLEWELLSNLDEEGLISSGMVYDAFSYDIEKAYCSREVASYVADLRREPANEILINWAVGSPYIKYVDEDGISFTVYPPAGFHPSEDFVIM